MEGSHDQDKSVEGSVGGNALQPVIVQVEENHLRLGCLQDQVSKLFDLQASLEWQLELAALNDNVGEVKKVDFKRIQHSLSGDNDLLRLLFHRQGSNQGSNFFGSLPLGQLTKTLLTCPDTCVDNLQEQLACSRVEYEDSTVDWLGGQVTLKGLMDGNSVHISVIHEPDDLVTKELSVVLRVQVWLGWLRRVELQTLSDTLSEYVEGRVSLADLGQSLLEERLHSREPVTKSTEEIVCQVKGNQGSSG
mmetsp:Transcript_13888/g.19296  ORF Transcript_13888/g.19296 Transcript_13888/m.19296 type:complete len:248 (-) Transcript_13888:2958-3701(-)